MSPTLKCHWVECQQNTPEWAAARLGKITASRFADVMAKGSHGDSFGKVAQRYASELVIESLTGKVTRDPNFKQMKWGNDNEAGARATYTLRTANGVDQVGFATHLELPNVGCSSDGLVGEEGCLEIKCPYDPTVHLKNFQTRSVPGEYRAQVQGNLWILQRDWLDFISYDPRYPDESSIYRAMIVRVHRSEDYIKQLAERVADFSEYLEELKGRVHQASQQQEAAENHG